MRRFIISLLYTLNFFHDRKVNAGKGFVENLLLGSLKAFHLVYKEKQ
jgi:hypothetical protein